MHLFYLHAPWIIDQKEYNCSSRSLSEWKNRGSVNVYQGTYFVVIGTIFTTLYILCLIGMYRGKLLKTYCYKLMFFNGIVDIGDLFLCSFITPYFHFTGAVFCSSVVMGWISGHLVLTLWFGASFNCLILAFNRFVEMVPYAKSLKFLFRDQFIYMWMEISVFYMVIVWFVLRPLPFNTVVSAYIHSPMITDSPVEQIPYTSIYLLLHNSTVVVVLLTLYSLLYYYVRNTRIINGNVDKAQIQLLVQVLCICSSTGVTAILYVLLEFLTVPRSIVIIAHVVWQLSHGKVYMVSYIFASIHTFEKKLCYFYRCLSRKSKPQVFQSPQ